MIAPVLTDDSAFRYPSLASLRAAHAELLRRQRESSGADLRTEVEAFICRGRATGALLDESEERWEAQSILDYWATSLFRMDRTKVDATLDELDPELAPELADADCPYVGLDAFRENKFEVFFGRQRMVEAMVERLASERFLAVVGDSGSGKSSVVLAGVLSALKAGALPGSASWRYPPTLVPGAEPLANLARALSPPDTPAAEIASRVARLHEDPHQLLGMAAAEDGRPCVLVIDQFEELFSLCEEEPVRQAFVEGLTALVEAPGLRHTLLLTMRSDYESRVAQLESFQALFERAHVRVTPLGSSELREAIVRPAELVGLKFEEGLVDALLQDILGEPAGLPLLQFTLLKLWEGRERNRVTWEAYRLLGGGRRALARSADEFYDKLLTQEQVTARRILLRMVRTSERLEVTSSRIQRKDLYRGGEAPGWIDRVLDKLVAARLVRLTTGGTPEEDQFEVAHEALVRNWPKLVEWLEQERAEITIRRRLEAQVEEWLRLKKQGGLLDEVQLLEAERWLAGSSALMLGYHPDLPELVKASREAIEEAWRKEEEARQRETEARLLAETERQRAEDKTRSSRIFRALAAILAVLMLLSIWMGWRAIDAQRQVLDAQKQAIEKERKLAEMERSKLEQQQIAAEEGFRAEQTLREQAEKARNDMEKEKARTDEAVRSLQKQKDLTEKAFQDVKKQKQQAVEARMRADEALKVAQVAKATAEAERLRAEKALEELQKQEEIAEQVRERILLDRVINDLEPQIAPDKRVLVPSYLLALQERTRPLQVGASISSTQGEPGSLCCIVKDKIGQRYLLSLPSVFEGKIGTPILQPAKIDKGKPETDTIAVLSRVGRSGAIAYIEPDVEIDPEISEIGPILDLERNVNPGDLVRVVGYASGIVEVRVDGVENGVVSLAMLPRPGDLGAAVLSEEGKLIGLLLNEEGFGVVTPIASILQELNVELVTDEQ